MQPIAIDDPRWLTSVPQLVAPRPDEWLPGLLLRCDVANGWASRTTFAHLLRIGRKSHHPYWKTATPNLVVIVAHSLNLSDLAHMLATTTTALRRTTYGDELARIFGLAKVHPTLLSTSFVFQLCPACVAQDRLLGRTLALPYIQSCPQHQLILQQRCGCGAMLQLFTKQTAPFTCHQCGVAWADLPQQMARAEQRLVEQHVLAWYAFFFALGTPTTVKRALHLIERWPVRHAGLLQENPGQSPAVRRRAAYRRRLLPLPLGRLIAGLVERDLFLDDSLREYLIAGVGEGDRCGPTLD